MNSKRYSIIFFTGSVCAAIAFFAWTLATGMGYEGDENSLQVTFFDVGQGDSIFIETPGGRQILIDGGPDTTVLTRLGEAMPFYDNRIDIVVLTHPDADHITGLVDVLSRYNIELVLDAGVPKTSGTYDAYTRVIIERGIPYYPVLKGDRIDMGEGLSLDVLHPVTRGAVSKINNSGLVLRLMYGERIFLFTADVEKEVERTLLQDPGSLNSDVLKVAHHGSKTSTLPGFVDAVMPRFAVISSGKNNQYGHPASSVLETLKTRDIIPIRTDEVGSITIQTDGHDLWVE